MSTNHNHSHHNNQMEHYTNTELIVREDIIHKTKELADLLTSSSEIQFYQKAEKQIADHEHVQSIIRSIKKKQKEIVAFESFQNAQMVSKIEKEIDQLQSELDSIPLVLEFKQTQEDINYLLQQIMSIIRDTISEKIHVETSSTEQPSSCSE